MYIEMYLFYIALVGVGLLLSYKVMVIRQYDKVNKNSIHFDPFPKTKLRIVQISQFGMGIVRMILIRPLGKSIFFCVVMAVRLANYLWVNTKRLGAVFKRNKLILSCIWKVRKLKKKIHKRLRKDLKD